MASDFSDGWALSIICLSYVKRTAAFYFGFRFALPQDLLKLPYAAENVKFLKISIRKIRKKLYEYPNDTRSINNPIYFQFISIIFKWSTLSVKVHPLVCVDTVFWSNSINVCWTFPTKVSFLRCWSFCPLIDCSLYTIIYLSMLDKNVFFRPILWNFL